MVILIPNLLGLLILSNVVVKKKKEFFKETRKRKISDLSTEALLIDLLTKNDISMEEAIDKLNKDLDIDKEEIKNASVNVKKIIG